MSAENPATLPPKRRWFQIHLSTALMLTLLAGVLMAMNFSPQANKYKTYSLLKFGWPWTAGYRVDWVKANTAVTLELFGELILIEAVDKDYTESARISYRRIAADVGFGLGVLLAAVFLFEWPIRRDEAEKARRQNPEPARTPANGAGHTSSQPAAASKPGRVRISIVSKLVLLLLSLVIIAANLAPNSDSNKDEIAHRSKYGFPWAVAVRTNFVDAEAREASLIRVAQGGKALAEDGWEFHWTMLPADLGVALGVLLGFLVVCEWAARSAFRASPNKPRGMGKTRSTAVRMKGKGS